MPPPNQRSRAWGFTLIEILLVIAIIAIVAGLATFTLEGFGTERLLRNTSIKIQNWASKASTAAVMEQKTYSVRINPQELVFIPPKDGHSGASKTYQLPEEVELQIQPWGKDEWGKPEDYDWIFEPNGLCEPLGIRLSFEEAYLEMHFHPLTAVIHDERSYFP